MNEVNLARQDRFSDARAYARSTEFRATMLDAQRTLFKPRIISTQAELTKLTETATEGDQVLCRNGQGGLWRFVYDPNNPEITDAYRWVFMGGSSLWDRISTTETTASLTYVALATAGPSITVPYAGLYDITVASRVQNVSGTLSLHSFDIGGTGADDAWSLSSGGGAANDASAGRPTRHTISVAGSSLVSKYRVTGGAGGAFLHRHIFGIPVRIGP